MLNAYSQLITELHLRRELEGGTLEDDIEFSYVERLDDLWWQLTEAERAQVEAEHAELGRVPADASLGLVDCPVESGRPRRQAA